MADGSVTIEVTLTRDQLEKGLKQVKSDLNGLSKTGTVFKSIGGAISSMGSAMQKAGKVIVGATAGIVAGLGTAVGRFDTLKNYPKVLSNLGISAEDAKKSINDLSEGIDGLPTALDDAASGVQRLVAKNGDIKKSTKYFLAMNDAIVAGNAPAEQQKSAIEQLTQAYSKGKFDMMEWRTLMMAMPGQLKQVATAMGYVNTDDLYNALQKGKISMDTFMNAIVKLDTEGGKGIKSFQEQAKNSTDSIGTALTNVSNRFKKGFATILEGLDEMAKGTQFGSIAGMINNFSTSIKNFLDKIGKSLKNSESAKNFIESMGNALAKLQEKVDNLSPEQVDKIVNAFITLAKAGPALLIFGKVFSIIGGGITKIGGLVETFGKLSPALAGGAKGATILKGAMAALTGPVGIVIAIITAVIAILVVLYKKSEIFRNAVNEAFASIKSALMSTWETIKPALEELWNALQELWVAIQPVAKFLINVLGVAIKIIAKLLAQIIPVIAKIIVLVIQVSTKILTVIINVVTKIITFFTKTIPDAFNNLINKIKEFVTNAINFFKNFPYNMGVLIGKAIGHLINFGIRAMNFVKTKIPQIVNGIVNWFKQLPSKIWNALVATIQRFIQWLSNMKSKASSGASSVSNSITNGFKSLPSRMLSIGKNIVQGLWNGIKNAGPWIRQKVGEFARGILDGMKQSLGIQSPSKLFRDEVGKYIAMGVGEGFTDNIAKVYRQMKTAVDFETQKLSANLSTTASFNKSIVANINIVGDVDLDGNKVGRLLTPSISRTLRTAGV